jgi:Family of unknown function (DUF6174)
MKVLTNTWLLILGLIVFTFLLVSCEADEKKANSNLTVKQEPMNSNNNFNAAEFVKNKDLWNRQNIANYEMVVEARNSSNIAKQVMIKVENHQAKSIIKSDPADNGSDEQYKPFDTVEKIFKIIERESKTNHDVFTVNYDSTFGYPSQVISDRTLNMADEEFSIKLLRLNTK